jgi:SAM-dependent methyltransferase
MTSPLSQDEVERIRRSRRRPLPNQFDYLHLRWLVRDLGVVLSGPAPARADVLDLYCGSRPYDDLLPTGARVVGFDVPENPYGVADIVSDDFLPFPDGSFDLVLCTQAFDFIADPPAAVKELARVLRPGGRVVLTVPLVCEYPRGEVVHRYTGPQLAVLFDEWDDVHVIEDGGRGVAWAMLTGSLLHKLEARIRGRAARAPVSSLFGVLYLLVNCVGGLIEQLETRFATGGDVLPMNLLLSARRRAA